jgi:hypothetical protein
MGEWRGKRRCCSWNGVEYLSIRQAAIANGYIPETMRRYIDKGFVQDADLLLVEWQGNRYKSISDAARDTDYTVTEVSRYINQGVTSPTQVPAAKRHICVVDGVEYKNPTVAAKSLGCSVDTINRRLRQAHRTLFAKKGEIATLGLPMRIYHSIRRAGISEITDLIPFIENRECFYWRNFGEQSFNIVVESLKRGGYIDDQPATDTREDETG